MNTVNIETEMNKAKNIGCCSSPKPANAQAAAGGCCDSNQGSSVQNAIHTLKKGIGISVRKINTLVIQSMKYWFHLLVIILFPTSFYRFFFKYGYFPLIKFSISLFCAVMAYWSH